MADDKKDLLVHRKERRGISKNVYFLTIALTVLIGFVAGTRSNELVALVAPVLGFKVNTSTLDLKSIQSTYQQLKANYDGTLDTQKLIDGASRGLVAAAGDQYTVFMDAKEADTFDKDLSGDIGGGIGAEIGIRNDHPTILRVLDNNPAQKAGLQAGDVIATVNDQSVADWTADKTASAVRGDVGTTLKITVVRAEQTEAYTITRQKVTNPSVESKVEDGLGILTISRFDDQTSDLTRTAAESFKQQNVRVVILDLRGNGGGYLTAAQDVAGLWLKDKVVVSERSNGKVVDELRSGQDSLLAGLPTVVLVNGASASASEIVAGALQDYNAATLIGEKTFGKGTVQKVLDLGAGTKLKVTVARWYTPNGKNITKEGIMPNQKIELSAADVNSNKDPQLDAAKAYLNK
ncbi:MAG: putative carboxyl-terminal protease [Candidatus Saccharibacteria bacterium]|nr:putative carboxyl-terminal protease [Candidatus Saccharibacteria bacterium]